MRKYELTKTHDENIINKHGEISIDYQDTELYFLHLEAKISVSAEDYYKVLKDLQLIISKYAKRES